MLKIKREERTSLLFKLAERFGWVCWYCNIPLQPQSHRLAEGGRRVIYEARNVSVHVDHVVPKSAGGSDDIENRAIACEFCNRAKLNMTAETYLSWLDRIRFGDTWSPIRDGKR